MGRSDSSRIGKQETQTLGRTGGGLQMRSRRRAIAERVLRSVVLATSIALIVFAVWHVTLATSVAAVTTLLGAEITQWILVVIFGCVLILAEYRYRPSGN